MSTSRPHLDPSTQAACTAIAPRRTGRCSGPRPGHRTRFSSTSASASMPTRQSAGIGVLLRRVGDPARVADEQHRRRHVRREHPGVVPGTGRDHRRGQQFRQLQAEPGIEGRPGRPSTRAAPSPCSPRRRPRRRTAATMESTIVAVTAADSCRTSSQSCTDGGDDVGAAGDRVDPADGGDRTVVLDDGPAGGEHRGGGRDHRVLAIRRAAWCRRGCPGR